MERANIDGLALWSPGIPSASAYLAGVIDEAVEKPPVDIIQSRMKRATSLMCRGAVEVVTHAARDAGWPLDSFATVFGSAHGEIRIAAEQMVMMQEASGVVSPARFKNSVHNTAAGLFSIGAKNRGFTTAVAAGNHTFPMALFEAWALLATGEADKVVVSISEEPPTEADHGVLGSPSHGGRVCALPKRNAVGRAGHDRKHSSRRVRTPNERSRGGFRGAHGRRGTADRARPERRISRRRQVVVRVVGASRGRVTRRVAITGVGVVTPIGHDLRSISDALTTGRHGIRKMPEWDRHTEMLTRVGAPVDVDLTGLASQEDP